MQIKLLDLLLRIKKIQEDQGIINRERITNLLKTTQKELEGLREERAELSAFMEKRILFKADELKDLLILREHLLEMQKFAENKLKSQKEELNKVVEELNKTHKERRLYERFRERVLSRQKMEEQLKFYKELDELVFLRKTKGLGR